MIDGCLDSIVTSFLALGQNVFETEIWRKKWRTERKKKRNGKGRKEKRKINQYNYCRKSKWNKELKINSHLLT